MKRIAVDAMGGDGGVATTLPAVLEALRQVDDIELLVVGDQSQISSYLQDTDQSVSHRLEFIHRAQFISDELKPATALRSGRDSSLFHAVELVRSQAADAMVSAGNTGALVLTGRHLLKTLPGIQKPALIATLPGLSRPCYLLDVGANPLSNAQQLFEFAVMGSVLAESLTNKKAAVGLLNIGSEQHKGTEEVQAAAGRLQDCRELNFQGFVEADALFETDLDVVVCNGFVGNAIIKTGAGVAAVLKHQLRQLGSEESQPAIRQRLSELEAAVNPQRFNGASLLGLQGSVVKSHGSASSEGFLYAILQACREVEYGVPDLIAARVAAIMRLHSAQ